MKHALKKDISLRTTWTWLPSVRFIRSNNFLRYRHRSIVVPFNSYSIVRVHNFCVLTGRSRGVVSSFGFSRHVLKTLFSSGKIFGVKKSSW